MFFMHSKCCWQNSFRRVLLKLKIFWLWAYLWTDLLRKWAIANFSLWYQLQKIFSSFSKYYEWDNHVMWLVLKIFNIPCPSVKNSWYWYIRHGQSRCSAVDQSQDTMLWFWKFCCCHCHMCRILFQKLQNCSFKRFR